MSLPQGYCLPLQHQQQKMTDDCWATCLAMTCQWRGVALSRQEILTAAPGIISGLGYGEMASCPEANRIVSRLSNQQVTFELLGRGRQLAYEEFVQYANRRRVVMLCMEKHMLLVVGYVGNGLLWVQDPAKPTGPVHASPRRIREAMVDSMVLNAQAIAPVPSTA